MSLASRSRLVLCGAVLACFTSASVAAATPHPLAHHLAAPVITETFTRLPCTHNTTLGLEGCAEGRLLKSDGRLNKEVALIFRLMSSQSKKRSFVDAEDLWLRYRSADCHSASDIYSGGTLAPVEYATCEVSDDVARSADLHTIFALLEQGSSTTLRWP